MAYRVHLIEAQASFEAQADESVLDAATRAGVAMPHECTFGACGTCRVKVMAGHVAYEELPMGLTPEEADEGYALACQARAQSDLELSVASSRLLFAEPRRIHAIVHSIRPLTRDVLHMALRFSAGEAPDFHPGQYLNICLPDGTTRSFSMASKLSENTLDFHVRRVPGGRFTDTLLGDSACIGTLVDVEAPLGRFCYHVEDWRPLVMVATGTGLAPIKAILESLFDDDACPPVSLYWGMRTRDDLYLAHEIEAWATRLCEFNFVPVLSQSDAAWTGRRGYVQDAVVQDIPDLSEHAIYLCGSPVMIADAKRRFAAHGASAAHVYADVFTFQHQAVVTA